MLDQLLKLAEGPLQVRSPELDQNAFSPEEDLGISSDQKEKLKKRNSSFLDNMIKISGGYESDDKKNRQITGLVKDQNSAFESIRGVKQYPKKTKKQIVGH